MRTLIYTPIGYFASGHLWNNAAQAFKDRNTPAGRRNSTNDWFYLGHNREFVEGVVNLPGYTAPQHDYDFDEFNVDGSLRTVDMGD